MEAAPHRGLLPSVYLPTFFFTVGIGAITPILPLVALDRGAGIVLAGLMVGLKGLGTAGFSIPSGVLAARLGERITTLLATLTLAAVGVGVAVPAPLWVYALLVTLLGAAWAIFNLARISFVTEITAPSQRGRVMATLGGIQRAGHVLGALAGGAFAAWIGVSGGFVLAAVAGVAASIVVWVSWPRQLTALPSCLAPGPGLRETFRRHRRVYASAALAVTALQVLRSARDVTLPLWGELAGLDPAQISTIFGMLLAVDLAVFYPVGVMLDRLGRRPVYVSSAATISIGLLLLPLTGTFATIAAAGLLMGLGTGLGNGINLTLSSDFAPTEGRGAFLGMWRFITDSGSAIGPVAVSTVAGLATLPVASVMAVALGAGGLVLFWKRVPETRHLHAARSFDLSEREEKSRGADG